MRVVEVIYGIDCWTDHRFIWSKYNLRTQPKRRPQGQKRLSPSWRSVELLKNSPTTKKEVCKTHPRMFRTALRKRMQPFGIQSTRMRWAPRTSVPQKLGLARRKRRRDTGTAVRKNITILRTPEWPVITRCDRCLCQCAKKGENSVKCRTVGKYFPLIT